jgi:tetratricopeptide (TPR) repeat protein
MSEKSAFVIMPIGANGSEDAKNYEKLYSTFLEKPLKKQGFQVSRADKVARAGSIFKDIIRRVIESDLVVADLSTLNPNVMLELGIRYASKPNGTILICDRSKTEKLPFDLSDYRTIFFDDTREGGAELLRSLEEFCLQVFGSSGSEDIKSTDSPVFSHYGFESKSAIEVELRREIADLKARLLDAESMDMNTQDASSKSKYSLPPSEMLSKAKEEIEGGNVPWELLSRAQTAVNERNISEFLACVERIMSLRAITLSDGEYRDLYYLADRLDLRNVLPTIIEIGLSVYPDSDLLKTTKMNYLAHSVHQQERQEAKDLISNKLRIDLSKGNIEIERIAKAGSDLDLLSIFLDAVHRDRDDELALKIVEKLYHNFPDSSVVVRNYARAVQRLKGADTALEFYLRSVSECADVDDTSTRWLASELWDYKRFREVIELSIVSCMIDLDAASNYATLAVYMSELLQPQNIFQVGASQLSKEQLSVEDLLKVIVYGRSCPNVSLENRARFEFAMQNTDITAERVQDYVDNLGVISRKERADYIRSLYSRFASSLTSRQTRNEGQVQEEPTE